jgi:hypothetical protein
VKLPRLIVVILCAIAVARGTTVIPPSFDELVRDSELIFRGRVTAVQSGWRGEGVRRKIATLVTFEVEKVLRGAASATLAMEFMGGEIGETRFELAGWPRFAVGDRGVFFVENRNGRVCPLFRLRHGRYRIAASAESGAEHILRDDFTPLRSTTGVGTPLAEAGVPARAAAPATAMTLREFEAQIAERSAALTRVPASR